MKTFNKLLACAMGLTVNLCTWAQTEIEPNNNSSQATAITYNTAMAGSIGACAPTDNSEDYFSFTPPSQGQLRVQSSMSNTGVTNLEVTFRVRQSSTAIIGTFTLTAGANGVPVNDSFLFPCQGTGLYYISIENPSGGACTNYSFTYDIVAPVFVNDAEPNNSSGQAVTVAPGVWHQGQIDFRHGDNLDYYRIDLPTNGVLNIEWEAEHAGTTNLALASLFLHRSSDVMIQAWGVPVGANSTPATQSVSINCRSNSDFYYLIVTTEICGTSYRFRYTVTPPLFANDAEPNNDDGSATIVPYNTPTDGQINFSTYVDNSDYYRIDLPTNGVLNIYWEAERAGPGGAVIATLHSATMAPVTSWNLPVGANSVATSQTVSIDCRSNSDFYYLSLEASICGVSYRFSYTVTPPVFANDLEPNNINTQATTLPHSTPTEGQINFSTYVDNIDYYRIDLPTQGVLNIHWEAEIAGTSPGGTVVASLRDSLGGTFTTWNLLVGNNSAPSSQTVSIDCRSNTGFYYLSLETSPTCGVSYRFSYTVTPPVFANDLEPNNDPDNAIVLAPNTDAEGQSSFLTSDETPGPSHHDLYRIDLPTNGVLNINWEAERTGGPGTAILELLTSTLAGLQAWFVAVGGSSLPLSETLSTICRGSGDHYYLRITALDCGVSYSLSYNVTLPVFGINPVAGTSNVNAPTIDLDTDTVTGQVGFEYGQANAYYRIEHGGGPLVLNLLAEHAGVAVQGYNVRLRSSTTALLNTIILNAGANSTPLAGQADHGTRAAATYYIEVDGTPCGMSFSIRCNECDEPIIYDCPALEANFGDPCDAGAGYVPGSGLITNTCECVGTPLGDNDQCVTLELQTDANEDQTSWEILRQGTLDVMCGGEGYTSNAVTTANCCIPVGCYILRVYDSAGDGIAGGGYILRTFPDNKRIIDNRNNFTSGSVSAISGDQGFCLPIGTDRTIYTSCDKLDWVNNQFIVASMDPAVSAEWNPGAPNSAQDPTSGYDFWFFDPNGSYSFVRQRRHNQPDGFGNVGAARTAHMQINNWAAVNHIPQNVLMNVRVRGVVNGDPLEWGPACRFKIDPVAAQCPVTKLMDIPGNQFLSCGQYREFEPGSYVHARPVSGATSYEFRFRLPAEGYEVIRTGSSYFVQLYWTVPPPLATGSQYEVDVRAFKGGQWCPWGDVCTLNIGTDPGMQGGSQNAMMITDATTDATLNMWPNPNNGDQLFISLSEVPEGVLTVNVDMFDLFGKRVMARQIAANDGFVNTVLDLQGEIPPGMYMVNIIAGEKVYSQRLVIQR